MVQAAVTVRMTGSLIAILLVACGVAVALLIVGVLRRNAPKIGVGLEVSGIVAVSTGALLT